MAFRLTQRRPRERGFTLIEALVATLIVALALAALTRNVSQGAKVARISQDKTFGRWVAMNAITELRLKPGLPDVGRSDGDEELANMNWRWTMNIQKTPVEAIRRVDLEVARTERPDVPVYKLSAFVGNNTVSDTLRPWSGWPDANDGSDDGRLTPPLQPGAPAVPGIRPDPRRGLNRSGTR